MKHQRSSSPKPPPNTPSVNDRVRLRGRGGRGTLTYVSNRLWAFVDWDAATPGPNIVHLFELEAER
jgi:hypothetical protein